MAYNLQYSDYPSTMTGPPDPERWVGPPGPQGIPGPQGVQGIPGQPTAGGPFLPIAGGSLTGALTISTGAGAGAIINYNGAQNYWAGAWPDGSFYISGPGGNRLIIGQAGATTIKCSSLAFFDVATPVAKRTGWTAATGTATRTTFVTGSVTLPALAEHVKALIDDLTAYGLIGT